MPRSFFTLRPFQLLGSCTGLLLLCRLKILPRVYLDDLRQPFGRLLALLRIRGGIRCRTQAGWRPRRWSCGCHNCARCSRRRMRSSPAARWAGFHHLHDFDALLRAAINRFRTPRLTVDVQLNAQFGNLFRSSSTNFRTCPWNAAWTSCGHRILLGAARVHVFLMRLDVDKASGLACGERP